MSGGFIGGMWYEENTYNEKMTERNERLENEKLEKERVIELIIEQKILKAGVKINPVGSRYRMKDMPLEQLKVILDKWEKI
jgi:hypothetical protein